MHSLQLTKPYLASGITSLTSQLNSSVLAWPDGTWAPVGRAGINPSQSNANDNSSQLHSGIQLAIQGLSINAPHTQEVKTGYKLAKGQAGHPNRTRTSELPHIHTARGHPETLISLFSFMPAECPPRQVLPTAPRVASRREPNVRISSASRISRVSRACT